VSDGILFLGECEWRVVTGCTGVVLGGVYHSHRSREGHKVYGKFEFDYLCSQEQSVQYYLLRRGPSMIILVNS